MQAGSIRNCSELGSELIEQRKQIVSADLQIH